MRDTKLYPFKDIFWKDSLSPLLSLGVPLLFITMTRTCEICFHPLRKDIENAILDGGPGNSYKAISTRTGVKPSQLLYHKENHMPSITEEAIRILDEQSQKNGVNRVLNSVEVLDLIISKAPGLMESVTMQDILRALKLKHEILGDIKEEKKVKLEWLQDVK